MPGLIFTKGIAVLSTHEVNLEGLEKCTHEEPDSHISVHARYASIHGSKSITIKADDTNILVIAVSMQSLLQNLGLDQLWLAFGQGQSLHYISVHDFCDSFIWTRRISMVCSSLAHFQAGA